MNQCRPMMGMLTCPASPERHPAGTPKVNRLVQKPPDPPVAIVAGDPDLRSAIAMLLTVSGMEAREYRTAKEFTIARFQPHHCVIASCPVPDVPDQHLCAALMLRRLPLPIILLTDFPDAFDVPVIDCESIRILHRPFRSDILLDTIKALTGPGSNDGSGGPGAQDQGRVAH